MLYVVIALTGEEIPNSYIGIAGSLEENKKIYTISYHGGSTLFLKNHHF
jgi:hypothetical protein